jgi:hypothetical protein
LHGGETRDPEADMDLEICPCTLYGYLVRSGVDLS